MTLGAFDHGDTEMSNTAAGAGHKEAPAEQRR